MKLVIYPPVDSQRLARISAVDESIEVINAPDEADAIRAMPGADALFGKLTPAMLAAADKLRWVQAPTVSLEHYVFAELIEHPCTLTNMRGLFSDVIADHVMGFVICLARNFHTYIRNQLQGRWEPVGGEAGRVSFAHGPGTVSTIDRAHPHLGDMTLGVVGLGHIGSEIARRARAFSMRIVAVDPSPRQAVSEVQRLWPPEQLSELLAESDFVVIAAPHTPATEKWFRREQFRQMKRGGYLINIGRGAIVDLADLTAALAEREIAGAALDVVETEPLPPEHPLWRMPNVIITPHVAGYCPRIAERHLAVVLDNLRRFVRGEPLVNVVDKAARF